eukprot:scaffold14339_cov107-Isochrysis_galbana.AAC.4
MRTGAAEPLPPSAQPQSPAARCGRRAALGLLQLPGNLEQPLPQHAEQRVHRPDPDHRLARAQQPRLGGAHPRLGPEPFRPRGRRPACAAAELLQPAERLARLADQRAAGAAGRAAQLQRLHQRCCVCSRRRLPVGLVSRRAALHLRIAKPCHGLGAGGCALRGHTARQRILPVAHVQVERPRRAGPREEGGCIV